MTNSIIYYFILSIILFIMQNWIGSKSYSKGYIKFSFLDEKDEALALNFMIKVLGPTVFIIIVAALLQFLKIPLDLKKIIWIVYFYIFLRISVIFIYQRQRIVNWVRIIIHYAFILLLASIIQKRFISDLGTLLPDFQEIKNEIWLLILVFLYQVGNSHRVTTLQAEIQPRGLEYLPELIPRKRKYILSNYRQMKEKYDSIVDPILKENIQVGIIIYSILIFENFNRPYLIRKLENLKYSITKKPGTFGIMQVRSNKSLSDIESIKSGTTSILSEYNRLEKDNKYSLFGYLIKYHCPDRIYIRQILFISKAIIDHAFTKEEKREKFKDIYGQISNEFGLYFYY